MSRALCLDCVRRCPADVPACPHCASPRLVRHEALDRLGIAHVDCDAFYAAVEKRDRPELADKPLIIGGGRRGVVATACYIARISGVRSAMPMFKALAACPDAVVLKPDMARYRDVSRQLFARFADLTPLVEPLSVDEAFLDLRGTDRLHRAAPAQVLARLAQSVAQDLGITISIGLSYNKFLAKLASDMRKPRGFTVLGPDDVPARTDGLPVERLWGVGPAAARRLRKAGYASFGSLRQASPVALRRLLGNHAAQLQALTRGEDARSVKPDRVRKSISTETTFETDIRSYEALRDRARGCAERVARELRAKGLAARTVTLKLKTAQFRLLTRSITVDAPTQSAAQLARLLEPALLSLADGNAFRLIGVAASVVAARDEGSLLFERPDARDLKVERAMDALSARFGDTAIRRGVPLASTKTRAKPKR